VTGGFDRVRAFQLFEQALGMHESLRARFIDENCGGTDAALRAEVESLLEAVGKDQPQTSVLLAHPSRALENLIGECYGRFRLVEFLGEGGMGVVYRAERIDGISQVVAIKLIANELGERGRERFLRETQLLARLEHPAIARLIDAGVEAGRAWIALEFVPGRPIDDYCDENHLPLRARVQLLVNLARAVAAAHGLLVVHRDIKPANVLVTADGSPKLIDFGIAAVLQDHGAVHSQTADIGRLFTPHYASPEQVSGEPVSVATDVFGLGALGYRLLTRQALYPEARGAIGYLLAITQQDVTPPSRCAAGQADPRVARELRGDLDAILCKALERDPSRRYASAADMQADLQRYLDDEPVLARPPSLAVKTGKFVRRNSIAVAISSLLAVVVLAAGIAYGLQVRRANAARDMAARRGEFLARVLNSADPRRGGHREITVAQLLDGSVPQLEAMVDGEPLVAASMFGLLAQTNMGLGRYAEGVAASDRAVDISRAHGAQPEDLAGALITQGELRIRADRNQDAQASFREALRLVEGRRGADRPLADALEGLAKASDNLGQSHEAEALYLREIAVYGSSREDFGGRPAFPYSGLGTIRFNQGRYAEAAKYVTEALSIARRHFPKDSPDLLDSEYDYAMILEQSHRAAEAEPVFRSLLDSYRRILGPEHAETFGAQQGLAHDLMSQGRYQEAADVALPAAQGLSRTAGENDAWTLTAWGVYGISACLSGHGEEGLTAMRRVAAARARVGGSGSWGVASTQVQIGTCLVALHRYAEAEPLLLRSAPILEKDRGARFDRTQAAYKALGELYANTGKPEQAAEWQSKLAPTSRLSDTGGAKAALP
jgi:serine/threonine-protein kinase